MPSVEPWTAGLCPLPPSDWTIASENATGRWPLAPGEAQPRLRDHQTSPLAPESPHVRPGSDEPEPMQLGRGGLTRKE